MGRGGDYGCAGTSDVTLPDGAELRAMLQVQISGGGGTEVSGTVQLDADYGGVVAVARVSDWAKVLKALIEQTGSHLKRGSK